MLEPALGSCSAPHQQPGLSPRLMATAVWRTQAASPLTPTESPGLGAVLGAGFILVPGQQGELASTRGSVCRDFHPSCIYRHVCVCIHVYIFVFIFISQLLFAIRDSSLWAAGVAGAPCLHEAPCFCFPVVGENWVKTSSFLKKMSCCCVWLVGDAVGSPAPSRGGWQGPVPVSHHEDIFLLLTHLSNWGGSLSYWADWSPIFGLYPCL